LKAYLVDNEVIVVFGSVFLLLFTGFAGAFFANVRPLPIRRFVHPIVNVYLYNVQFWTRSINYRIP
jgi:hypothetical protein